MPSRQQAYGYWSAAPNWGPLVHCDKTAIQKSCSAILWLRNSNGLSGSSGRTST